MKLLGDANWWLPAWLDRLLPTIDLDSESGLPVSEPASGPAAEPEPAVAPVV
jgi:RND superfamily putative drug exporter